MDKRKKRRKKKEKGREVEDETLMFDVKSEGKHEKRKKKKRKPPIHPLPRLFPFPKDAFSQLINFSDENHPFPSL